MLNKEEFKKLLYSVVKAVINEAVEKGVDKAIKRAINEVFNREIDKGQWGNQCGAGLVRNEIFKDINAHYITPCLKIPANNFSTASEKVAQSLADCQDASLIG